MSCGHVIHVSKHAASLLSALSADIGERRRRGTFIANGIAALGIGAGWRDLPRVKEALS